MSSNIPIGCGIAKVNLFSLSFIVTFINLLLAVGQAASAQSNSSNVTNQAAPSASSVTSGGFNYNYQSNNTFNNDFGFGPGVVCRTPVLYVGGNYGNGFIKNNGLSTSTNLNENYGAQIGLAVPFGSSILDDCKNVASHVAMDRQISTELSMIRACASLVKEGITVDPVKFPNLSKCVLKPGDIPFVPGLPKFNSAGLRIDDNLEKRSNSTGSTNSGNPIKKPKVTID